MQTVISITSILLSVIFPLYFFVRKERKALPLSLSAALLSAAALELFDLLTFLYPDNLFFWKKFALAVESSLPPVWLWFTLTYARQNELRSISLLQRLLLAASPLFAVSVLLLPVTSFFYSPDFSSERVLYLGNAGFIFYLLLLIYLIIPLINLEMTLTSATQTSRLKIKFELLGAGALLAVMVFYYSQGLLFRTINMNLVPVRTVLLIVAVAMMAYSRLRRGNGVNVYVSQQILYRSVVLLTVGVYLLGLGLMGEGMKYFGDWSQRAMAITLAFVAGLGLIVTLLSETVRRKVRVFINKNFYRNKYDYRNQWLQFTDRLSSAKNDDDLLRSIITGFCDTFGMGCGALFLLEQERATYQVAASIEMDNATLTFREKDAAIEFIANGKWVVDPVQGCPEIGDEEQKTFFKANAIFFAIPLFMNERMGGFIVLGRPLNRDESYSYEDFDLMKTLARQASSALLNLRLSDQLARSREMAAMGRVATFVMHDLKNLVSALSLMLDNVQEYIADPEFQKDLLDTLGNTVTKMNSLISRLKHLPEKVSLQRTPVDLLQLAHDTTLLVKGGNFLVTGAPVIAEVDRDEIQKVALNLMLNAIESTAGKKPVTVEVGKEETPFFRVKDEGCGIPEDFLRNSLFTPFKSTKKKGLGIGLYQCKKIVEAHGGKIEVISELDKGSEFTVWLPDRQWNSDQWNSDQGTTGFRFPA
ncbi:MAG TPA: XrtA/PEP-CTERM system histidine kinase PrsK [Geobacteraceae bacterium]|nr:XrtA/PEP-CTERM system histidine kinase PrsK [Geobacteraceae bacterium]